MPFCASCGAQVEGRFCPKCGSAVAAAGPGAGPASSGAMPPPPAATSAGLTDNMASALCYSLGLVTGIIFLVLEPYNKNKVVRFHAFQSIFMCVALIVLRIALSILFGILWSMSGLFFALALFSLYGFVCFILWLFLIISAYQGKTVVLPIIGPLAQQQA